MHRHAALAAAACCCAVAAAHYFVLSRDYRPLDDAFIFFRYTDNFLHGHGIAWNPGGERVEGYTSFLYFAVLLCGRLAGWPAATILLALNGLLFVTLVALSASFAVAVVGSGRRGALLAPALVATSHALALHARLGLESMLVVVLLLGTLRLYIVETKRLLCWIACGLGFGLLLVTRLESALALGVATLAAIAWNLRDGRRVIGARELTHVGCALAVALPHLLWRHAYYGFWLPNTFYAKMTGSLLERTHVGLHGLADTMATLPGMLVASSLIVWGAIRRQCGARPLDLLAALTLLWPVELVIEGIPSWLVLWYATPIFACATLLLGTALGRLAEEPPATRRPAGAGLTILGVGFLALFANAALHGAGDALRIYNDVAGLLVVALVGWAAYGRRLARGVAWTAAGVASVAELAHTVAADAVYITRYPSSTAFYEVADALKSVAQPGDTVAVGAAGIIPYFTGLVSYDTLGLNDVQIAHEPLPPGRHYAGYASDRGDGPYVFAKRPTYLIPNPGSTSRPNPGLGTEKSFLEIGQIPAFYEEYAFKSLPLPSGRFFNFYERRRAETVVSATPGR